VSLWNAKSLVDGDLLDRYYVYISPSCSWSELEKTNSILGENKIFSNYTVVLPRRAVPQLEAKNIERTRSLLPNTRIQTLKTLYFSAAQNRNLQSPDSSPVENFVEQKISFPEMRDPVAALTTIVRWLRGDLQSKHKVAVLLAPGGQGKTTLARQIFDHFSTRQYEFTIPLLVNSLAWKTHTDNVADMEDVSRSINNKVELAKLLHALLYWRPGEIATHTFPTSVNEERRVFFGLAACVRDVTLDDYMTSLSPMVRMDGSW